MSTLSVLPSFSHAALQISHGRVNRHIPHALNGKVEAIWAFLCLTIVKSMSNFDLDQRGDEVLRANRKWVDTKNAMGTGSYESSDGAKRN